MNIYHVILISLPCCSVDEKGIECRLSCATESVLLSRVGVAGLLSQSCLAEWVWLSQCGCGWPTHFVILFQARSPHEGLIYMLQYRHGLMGATYG